MTKAKTAPKAAKSTKKELTTMTLWDKVSKTDPAVTKHVNQRGGFTAIGAQSQIKRATELWGPMGGKWGLKTLQFGQIPFGREIVPEEVTLIAEFFYPEGEILIATDMAYKAGNDSRKKLMTDATTKALSKLGFNSDVFEGKFDDNKYVDGMREQFNGNTTGKKAIDIPRPTKAKTPHEALKGRMVSAGVATKEKYELLLHHLFEKGDMVDLSSADMAELRALITKVEAGEMEIKFEDGGVQINDSTSIAPEGYDS